MTRTPEQWEAQHRRDRARIDALETELDEALAELARVKRGQQADAARWMAPFEFGLTPHESDMLCAMYEAPGLVTKQGFMNALYGLRPNDEPEPKIVDVFICKIRKKLEPWGIEILTRWGAGYELSSAARIRLRELLGAERAA